MGSSKSVVFCSVLFWKKCWKLSRIKSSAIITCHNYQAQTKETMKRYVYIYIYIGNEGVKHNNKFEEQRKAWKLELNLLKTSDGKNKHTEPTQEILKIGGLLWLAKSVRSRQTADRDITTCFCVCFFIHAVTFSLREHPVFSSLVSPTFIFRRERSDDRKYVCGSHATSPCNCWTLKLSTKANKHFHIPIGGQRRGRWRAICPPPPPNISVVIWWYCTIENYVHVAGHDR